MTKIDFYITSIAEQNELLHFACRLTEKAYRKQHDVYLHTMDNDSVKQLDDLLWTFRANSFLPHRSELASSIDAVNTAAVDSSTIPEAPDVLIGCSGNTEKHHDVLVNLTHETPAFFSRFERVAELVLANDSAKAKSRERYKFYRERGYPIQVHNL